MEEWAHRKNIEHFERDLASETDPERRRTLQGMIEREKTRLAQVQREKSGGAPKG